MLKSIVLTLLSLSITPCALSMDSSGKKRNDSQSGECSPCSPNLSWISDTTGSSPVLVAHNVMSQGFCGTQEEFEKLIQDSSKGNQTSSTSTASHQPMSTAQKLTTAAVKDNKKTAATHQAQVTSILSFMKAMNITDSKKK